MYIISETLASNDPRWLPKMERIFSHWIYTSYYIPPSQEHLIDISKYNAEIVPQYLAKAGKFGNVNKGRIPLRTGTLAHQEVYGTSTEEETKTVGIKEYYYLNEKDYADALAFLKLEMQLYLKTHYEKVLEPAISTEYSEKRSKIFKEIEDCKTVIEAKILMYKRFGLNSLYQAHEDHGCAESPTFDLSIPGKDNFSY
jgi:hypothetical protein